MWRKIMHVYYVADHEMLVYVFLARVYSGDVCCTVTKLVTSHLPPSCNN